MYANEPLILAVMLADRRADLQRAASPSRHPSTNARPGRMRRLIGAVMQRKRPDVQPSKHDQLVPLEVATTARPDPGFDETTFATDEDVRELDAVLV